MIFAVGGNLRQAPEGKPLRTPSPDLIHRMLRFPTNQDQAINPSNSNPTGDRAQSEDY